MDTSKEYISMCEKAVEIQKEWKPAVGDWCVCSLREIGILDHRTPKWVKYNKTDGYYSFTGHKSDGSLWASRVPIWLPRQDQLQGMVDRVKDRNHFTFRFNHFLMHKYIKVTEQPAFVVLENTFDNGASMEQLWLAFVMKEKFNKTWTGNEWV